MKVNLPCARGERIVVQNIGDEVLVYDLDNHKAVCLNRTAAVVWRSCDGERNVSQIALTVGEILKSQVNDEVVWLALDQLKRENLLLPDFETSRIFSGHSRRDVIRKVALASMIALPVVSSLVAPLAVHANSLCVTGGVCNCTNTAGPAGEACATNGFGTPCPDANCVCRRTTANLKPGTCVPV